MYVGGGGEVAQPCSSQSWTCHYLKHPALSSYASVKYMGSQGSCYVCEQGCKGYRQRGQGGERGRGGSCPLRCQLSHFRTGA